MKTWRGIIGAGLVAVLAWCGVGSMVRAQEPSARFLPPQPGGPPPWRLGLVDSRSINLGGWGPDNQAVQVLGVVPGGPAARAGVEAGDVIVAANDRRVRHPDELRRVLVESGGQLRVQLVDVRTHRLVVALIHLEPLNTGPLPPNLPTVTEVSGRVRIFPASGTTPATVSVFDGTGWQWNLDFAGRPDLAAVALRYDGRAVVATGVPGLPGGIGIPERRTLRVTALRGAGPR